MRQLALLLLFFTTTLVAGEYARLRNGSVLHVDHHELDGGRVRLFIGPGFAEMEASEVQGFESDGAIPLAIPPKAPPAAHALPEQPSPGELADAAADRYGLPRKLIRSVMANESAFQADAVSPKGAIGLMQLLPSTARELGADPRDPAQNVDAGTRYLRDLLLRYDGLLWHALAAYNAGPGAVDRHNAVPPYRETVNYIRRIDRDMRLGASMGPAADSNATTYAVPVASPASEGRPITPANP